MCITGARFKRFIQDFSKIPKQWGYRSETDFYISPRWMWIAPRVKFCAKLKTIQNKGISKLPKYPILKFITQRCCLCHASLKTKLVSVIIIHTQDMIKKCQVCKMPLCDIQTYYATSITTV